MQQVYDYIDDHWNEALDQLARLCALPSVSARGTAIAETAQLTAEMMKDCGLTARVLPVPGADFPVVYGEARGESPATLLFYNHYDVQPPEPLELWSSPPFELTQYQDVVRARGASDNKGNIAARLFVLKAYQKLGRKPPVSVKFLVEGEEEIGSVHLGAFVQQNSELLKADACIWEGGGVNWEGRPTLRLGLKGILCLELEARGASRDVHSSMAGIVPAPAWRLAWALASLKDRDERIQIKGFYDNVRPPTEREIEAAMAMPVEEEQTKQSLGLRNFVLNATGFEFKRRHLFESTCNICGIETGYAGPGMKTVLPCLARAKIDFRLVPDQRPEEIMTRLRQHLDSHGFSDIVIGPAWEGENPARTPIDSPFVKVVAEAAREVYRAEPVLIPTMTGSGPMFYFTDTLGMPTVCAGVEYPDSKDHAPDENIRIVDFIAGMKHVAAIMEHMAANRPS